MKKQIIIWIGLLLITSSCGFKISIPRSMKLGSDANVIISGTISPLVGLISSNQSSSYLITTANAAACADPVYVKLFKIASDGSVDETNPLSSFLVSADAKYFFDTEELNLTQVNNVQYLVRTEGCNGDIFKRPVTDFNDKQDIDAKSTIVSEVVNATSLVSTTLNNAKRQDVEVLINSISGSSIPLALVSLTTEINPSTQFSAIFGASPSIIQDSKPEIKVIAPASGIDELSTGSFSIQAFHVDPGYSFAYVWKIDGVVKSTNANFNYIPSANTSGPHNVDLYVGKNDGSGGIDLTKPYYAKTIEVVVNNNILPTPPNISLDSLNLGPVNSTSISVNLATGAGLVNCESFSHLAITRSSSLPSSSLFTIDCSTDVIQIENTTISAGDGTKTLYLWAIDNEGHISTPKTVSVVLDTLPPIANLNFASTLIKGGSTQIINLSGSDAGVGLDTLKLYFSSTGAAPYSLIANLSTAATSYSWATSAINTVTGKLQLVARDLTGLETIVYSSVFGIDSIAPSTPAIVRTSSNLANSTTIVMSTTCSADYDGVFYSETSTTPLVNDANWEACNATKSFTVSPSDGTKTIYAWSRDQAGNISSSSNITMTLDRAAPAAPVANRSSDAISSSTGVAFTVTDCLDRPSVLVSESMIAPAANDSSWQTCSTSPGAISYVLVGPAVQGIHNLYVYAKDAVGNISLPTATNVIYDTTKPTLFLATIMYSLYKGGDTVLLNFSTSDANGISNLKLEYAADGSTYTPVVTLASNATTYTWTVPSSNTVVGKLKLTATDNATTANVETTISNTFSVDSIAPTAPSITRTSAQYTTINSMTIAATCTADYRDIIYSSTSTVPSLADANWETCASSKVFTTAAGDGVKTAYAFTRDLAGNISSASSVNMTLDTTLPTLSFTSFNSGEIVAGGDVKNITWSASDTNMASTPISIYYTIGGVDTLIGSGLANSGSRSWTIPTENNSAVKLKMIAIDLAGNQKTVTSNSFTIDSIKPDITSFAVASGATSVNTPTVSIQLAVTELHGPIQMRFSEDVAYANDSWQTYSATNGSYSLSMTPGSKTVYAWVKDSAGNISDSKNTSISLDFGSPPVLSITGPDNAVNFSAGSTVTISWNCNSSSGLSTTPIKEIKYTTDNGATFVDIAAAQNNNDTATTGHYDWMLPAALNTTPFRLWLKCESASGAQVERLSNIYQTGGSWKIWAGQLSAKRDGVVGYGAKKLMLTECSTGAMDSSGNLYYTSSTNVSASGSITALMKINAVTGIIEKVTGDYFTSASTVEDLTSGLLSSHKIKSVPCSSGILSDVILGTSVDRSEILFLDNTSVGAKIYGIKANNTARLYATIPLAISTRTYYGQSYFFSKNRILFYFASGKLYSLDLSVPGNSANWIYGTGTGNAAVNVTVGTEGTLAPLKTVGTSGTGNTDCSECLVLASSDGNRLWVGGGFYSTSSTVVVGVNTWAQLDRNSSDGKYYVTSDTIPAMRSMNNAIASDFDNKIYARSRAANSTLNIFDPTTGAAPTTVSVNGFNGLTGSFYYNLFSTPTNLYMVNKSQEIQILNSNFTSYALVAGSNAYKVGDGQGASDVDFSLLSGGLHFDPTSGLLGIIQDYNLRFYNYMDTASGFFSSIQSASSSTRLNIKKGGAILGFSNSAGLFYYMPLNLTTKTASTTVSQITPCGGCMAYNPTYDYELQGGIPDGTGASVVTYFFGGLISGTTAPLTYTSILTHSNGNFYFHNVSDSNNYSYIYIRKPDGKVYKLAGKSGAAGYSVSDSNTVALGAQLSNRVSMMYEIRNGSYAGDMLIVDGSMIRRISISTESTTPKIYDIVNLALATNFSASTVIDDIFYDESSETVNGLGSGTFYYVRTSPSLQIHKWKLDSGLTTATDTTYILTGLTLAGAYRLVKTPDGLLVAEASQNRILRLPP